MDRNGNLFVSEIITARYMRFWSWVDTTPSRWLASSFTFDVPSGLAVDGNGNVFVSDVGNVAIYEILVACRLSTINQLAMVSI